MVSNVFMGEPLNRSGDLLPPGDMYEACRVLAKYVQWQGGLQWDFSALHDMVIPAEFSQLIHSYLKKVLSSKDSLRGWKIPETTLVFPWIVRMFPEIKFIHWVRNPRDNILARHLTDDLTDFGISYPVADAFLQERYPHLLAAAQGGNGISLDELRLRVQRAISWQYQYEIVKATPKPAHWIAVRFEDFVMQQEATLHRLEEYLGFPLARIIVRPESVGRYDKADGVSYFDFLAEGMQEFGYEIPAGL
jgi:hypothetical protein